MLNCFLHFYLFESITASSVFELVRFLLSSLQEMDIEILIFLLHNIGLQLRKSEPDSLKQVLDLFTQKYNSFQAESKMLSLTSAELTERKQKERKLSFLHLELQDIRNNKGSITLQVRSIEHMQTWLRKNRLLHSSLQIQPLQFTCKQLQASEG